jgi:hypothetical protein
VLDAHTELERLRLEGHALRGQRLPGVARAVSRREHERRARDLTAGRGQRAHVPGPVEREPLHARSPVEADAQRLEPRAQARQDPVQAIGADVRARVPADLRGRAARHQLFEQR